MVDAGFLEDITGQFEAQLRWQRQQETQEIARAEATEITLSGRLLASRGTQLELRLVNGESIHGVVVRVTQSWLLLRLSRVDILVNYAGIESVRGLEVAPQWPSLLEQRLPLSAMIRELAERGEEMVLATSRQTVSGIVVRVGQDFLDLVDHDRNLTIPFRGLLSVTCPRMA